MQIRPTTPADAHAVAETVLDGDRTFAEFAPDGWTPPPYDVELEFAREMISSPDRWKRVAEVDGQVVGYVAFLAAALTRRPSDEVGLAHLARLFVRPPHWGTGVASALHDEAIAAAADQGFTAMRLFTPTHHGRARRFYEREGWRALGEIRENELGLPLTEYRRAL
jgi:GNAT superfamily N-acetyltransferase